MTEPVLAQVLIGQVAPLKASGTLSSIIKRPVPGPWRITSTGIMGDAQADLKNHGGREKAIHQYPRDHYAAWRAEIGDHPDLSEPGAFGENLSASGWTEREICIGDVALFGSSVLQISQGRQPCFKLNLRFGRPDMAVAVQKTGRTGWYWRVLAEGSANEGDQLVLVERPRPEWTVARLLRVFYIDTRNYPELEGAAALPELAENWRALARRRLETGKVEDWSRRLGPTGVDSWAKPDKI